MRRSSLICFAPLLVLAACAAGSSSGSPASSRNSIQAPEILETEATNAYEAIAILRPTWLRSRGPTSVDDPTPRYPHVFVDGTFIGELDFLRRYLVRDVAEIRYLDPGRAASRYGMGHPRGIIEIISARR